MVKMFYKLVVLQETCDTERRLRDGDDKRVSREYWEDWQWSKVLTETPKMSFCVFCVQIRNLTLLFDKLNLAFQLEAVQFPKSTKTQMIAECVAGVKDMYVIEF